MQKLEFDVIMDGGNKKISMEVKNLYIAGFAGRNIAKTKEHIEELAKLGVPRPNSIPEYYVNGTNLLIQDNEIQVVGSGSSGEVEFIVLRHEGEIYVGIGSDHTDRDLESVDIPKAKQICPKPVGKILWKYSDVKEHWDELVMESWQIIDGEKVQYQMGTAADLLPLEELIKGAGEHLGSDLSGAVMFSGTVATVNGIKPGSKFFGRITDKKLNRILDFEYVIAVI